ncbi:MAG TPA: crosslink repair DNA glycosylase YcaQ family protein [Gemmatimonadaceae bacterium]|nr:crosslink repair DNA glycosylase YcaQ family protein [Gemmatimonadaceae bacterium]
MKLTDIARQRLANQHLTGPRLATPSAVVATLGAVQAQDYPGAKWALAQRTLGAVDETVEKEMTRGSILRTHVLRPTWHFVVPKDIRWMLTLTAPRVSAAMASYIASWSSIPPCFAAAIARSPELWREADSLRARSSRRFCARREST